MLVALHWSLITSSLGKLQLQEASEACLSDIFVDPRKGSPVALNSTYISYVCAQLQAITCILRHAIVCKSPFGIEP